MEESPIRVDLVTLGVTVGVELDLDDAAAATVLDAWSRCSPQVRRPSGRSGSRVWVTGPGAPEPVQLVGRTPLELADELSRVVTLAVIEARRGDLLLLHAGAVAAPDGAVLAFLGPSGRGKTTAARALGSSLGYVTDETTGVADDLTVLAHPKPLSVADRAAAPGKAQVGPDAAGLCPLPPAPLRLARLALLDRRPELAEGTPARAEAVPFADVVGELVPQVSYLPAREAPLRRLRAVLDACGGLHRVVYRDAVSLVELADELLGGAPALAPRWGEPALGAPQSGGAPGYRRTALADSVTDGESLVVLRGDEVRVVDGLGPTLLRAAQASTPVERLVAEVVAVHGSPPGGDATALVVAAVDQLVAAGLMERTAGTGG